MLNRHGAPLPPMAAAIFDMIEASRWRGVTIEVLRSVFFSDVPQRVGCNRVKAHVWRINDFLQATDVRVRMPTRPLGTYHVVPRGVRGAGVRDHS